VQMKNLLAISAAEKGPRIILSPYSFPDLT